MALTSQQVDSITEALLAGYTTNEELHQFVRLSLNKPLDEIALGENDREIVVRLVDWGDQHGCLGNLIDYAYKELSHNDAIRKVYTDWYSRQLPTKPGSPPAEAAGALVPSAAIPPSAPQARGKRHARVIIEGDDTTVILGGSIPIRPSAAAAQVQAPGLRVAAPARSKLYLRLVAALLLAALVLLAFMLGRSFTNPPPAPAPAAAASAPGGIGLPPGPLAPLSAPHL